MNPLEGKVAIVTGAARLRGIGRATALALAEMGAILAPPVPGFYHQPQTIMDIVDQSVDRVLDLLGLPSADAKRWDGAKK